MSSTHSVAGYILCFNWRFHIVPLSAILRILIDLCQTQAGYLQRKAFESCELCKFTNAQRKNTSEAGGQYYLTSNNKIFRMFFITEKNSGI